MLTTWSPSDLVVPVAVPAFGMLLLQNHLFDVRMGDGQAVTACFNLPQRALIIVPDHLMHDVLMRRLERTIVLAEGRSPNTLLLRQWIFS